MKKFSVFLKALTSGFKTGRKNSVLMTEYSIFHRNYITCIKITLVFLSTLSTTTDIIK